MMRNIFRGVGALIFPILIAVFLISCGTKGDDSSDDNGFSFIHPESGEVFSTTQPTFSWKAYSNAKTYFIRVMKNDGTAPGTYTTIWDLDGITSSSVTYNQDGTASELLQPGQTYRANLYADSDGVTLEATGDVIFSISGSAVGSGFTTSNLQGTWNFHTLQSGDAAPFKGISKWSHGWEQYDDKGTCTSSYSLESNGHASTDSGWSLLIDSSGVITASGYQIHGVMNKEKDIMVTVDDGGVEDYRFSVLTKAGGTFTTADFQGTWNWQQLTAGDAPEWNGWAYGQLTSDASGNITVTSYLDSDGVTDTGGNISLAITSDGIVTAPSNASFHGAMNIGKDLFAITMDDFNGGFNLIVYQKSGGSFSTADLQGNWWTHGIVSGDAPAQKIGWFYAHSSIDASGNITSSSYLDSKGLSALPTSGTFSISSDGTITTPTLHGIMNSSKDMIVFTFTGCPNDCATGVSGYVMGVMLKR